MTPENLLTEWSRVLFESLADAGLETVVVSPGSRSTPLVWAALRCPRLTCRSVVDERSAGFYALGTAKVTGRPAAVVCTSGSAAANYFPAVVEARLARIPLVVITADRPFELQDVGASQTIDQTKIFGDYVRRFADLGMPEASPVALRSIRRRAAQAMFDVLSPEPGPVHLNVRARKPLEPAGAETAEAVALRRLADAVLGAPISEAGAPRRIVADADVQAVAHACAAARCGLVVCGPGTVASARGAKALRALSSRAGFPVYAEATSQLRFGGPSSEHDPLVLDALDVLFRSPAFRDALRPDLIVQVGEPPTSAAFERFVAAHPEIPRYVVAEHGWPDPANGARRLLVGDLALSLERLAAMLERGERNPGFAASLALANRAAWKSVEDLVANETSLSEGAAVRAIVESLPEGTLLSVGNSLPVRHLDAFCPAGPKRIPVFSQRGASGIDGVVSAAAGVASAAREPTVLVVGDVSALHDMGGFAVAAESRTPFVVVVLNNDGGRIFEQLPLAAAALPSAEWRFWTTPHGRTFGDLARFFGIAYANVSSVAALRSELSGALGRPACSLLEVTVPPNGAADRYRELAHAVDAAVRPLLAG
jgi:2-succinyl-5-enolpyruvyl-6-hydroxy-3-cyclohexene-1-carboxylate synthase